MTLPPPNVCSTSSDARKMIRKLPKTHRYHLTKNGRVLITTILAAHQADVSTLLKAAA
jgi:hypothetical protein